MRSKTWEIKFHFLQDDKTLFDDVSAGIYGDELKPVFTKYKVGSLISIVTAPAWLLFDTFDGSNSQRFAKLLKTESDEYTIHVRVLKHGGEMML